MKWFKDRLISIRCHARTGFTLVELLVVISIIALLLSILMPSLQKARQSAQAAICKSNLKQVGVGLQVYLSDSKEDLPPYSSGFESDGTSATIDGVTYNKFRRYLLIRAWETSSRSAIRDGGGFLGPYLATKAGSKMMILGCPSLPKDKTKTINGTWGGLVRPFSVTYYFSYGPNYEQVTSGSPSYGPLSVNQIKNPSALVYAGDSSGVAPYIATWSISEWKDYSIVAPGARHSNKFNAVFVDGHLDSGTMDKLYTPQYFMRQP